MLYNFTLLPSGIPIMLTPEGLSVTDSFDRIMLFLMWAKKCDESRGDKRVIFAGIGNPTYPINRNTTKAAIAYWQYIQSRADAQRQSMENTEDAAVINYGNPLGDLSPRRTMAKAMTAWYASPIEPDDILFTVGGAGGLNTLFQTFSTRFKKYRVITPFPYYTLYADPRHELYPIPVMEEPGYKLTARALERSIQGAYAKANDDGIFPKVFLLCNPNNPLGTVLSEDDLIDIAAVLRQYPDLYIVLDEAYAEICFNTIKPPSFLAIAPDLKPRTLLLRSATKALSAAGERMAILINFAPELKPSLLAHLIRSTAHAPRGNQYAYAETMAQFTKEVRQGLVTYYQDKVTYVAGRLASMGASMPDSHYRVEGTFYILADLSDLIGLPLPATAEWLLERTGLVRTSEDIAYYLLFTDYLMIAPLCYFGLPTHQGIMRITCSADAMALTEMMNRLESCLYETRLKRYTSLLNKTINGLAMISEHDNFLALSDAFTDFLSDNAPLTCLNLKNKNSQLMQLSESIAEAFGTERHADKPSNVIRPFFQPHDESDRCSPITPPSLRVSPIRN